jgi:prepilin-type processing-associated H-X9-DG protein
MEQNAVVDAVRYDLSSIDPRNWPPPWGSAQAASAVVSSYICPSTPPRVIDYQPYFTSQGLGNPGPFLLGATDYGATRGFHGNFRTCAPQLPSRPDDIGALGVPVPNRLGTNRFEGLMTGPPSGTGPYSWEHGLVRLSDMLDGTSNTFLVGETAGSHQRYLKNKQALQPNTPGTAGWNLNAAWADKNTYIRVRGFSPDGAIVDGGCCAINCSNTAGSPHNQLYSFHAGAVNVVRCDGSVQSVRDSIAIGVLVAMFTRKGGEALNLD